MITWTRATQQTVCGGPGQPHSVAIGDPVLAIRVHGMTRTLTRCATCAQALYSLTPPADLPPLVERTPTAITPTPLARQTSVTNLRQTARDWKLAQANEPVED